MINIAICDDEKSFIDKNLKELYSVIEKLHITANIETYLNSSNLLADISDDKKHFDLILLDIEMPAINGMDMVNKMKPYLPNVKIIFITSHMEYVLDAFDLMIFRYVPKGDTTGRLEKAIQDALSLITSLDENSYQIKVGSKNVRVLLKDVYCIKRDGKNAVFHLECSMEKIRKPLKVVFEEIGLPEFIFIDRGIIVNIIHVMKVCDGFAYMRNGDNLAISRSNINEVKEKLTKYWGEHI